MFGRFVTDSSNSNPVAGEPVKPTFGDALRFWFKLGLISFGGPSGQIAIMHTELVERRRWITDSRFLHALNYCMLLPGPEAQQLATYCGWLLHGVRGGIVAGVLFVLPSAILLWLLSYVYMAYGEVKWVAAVFAGLKPAVLAIVMAAVLRIGMKALKNVVMWGLAGLAFGLIYFVKVPFPAIIFGAAFLGLVGGMVWPQVFGIRGGDSTSGAEVAARPSLGRGFAILAIGGLLWFLPLAGIAMWLGEGSTQFREGLFFSKAAMVTFGGAYAVLPYVGQQAVEHYGWLQPGQMMDGLGLAETTPGPLVMVLQFVGFVGGWQNPGNLSPLVSGTVGALITTWVTFVPCFIWILLGAPYIERLQGNRRLSTALTAVTAAVVGVILNLAIWFGLHTLVPVAGKVDWLAAAVAVGAFIGMVKWKWDIVPVVLGAAVLGLVRLAF